MQNEIFAKHSLWKWIKFTSAKEDQLFFFLKLYLALSLLWIYSHFKFFTVAEMLQRTLLLTLGCLLVIEVGSSSASISLPIKGVKRKTYKAAKAKVSNSTVHAVESGIRNADLAVCNCFLPRTVLLILCLHVAL